MGNRLSGRARHKKPTSGDVSTSSTRTGKSPPSSGSVSVRLRAAAVRVGYRRRGGRSSEQIVSCPNLGDDDGGDGQRLQLGGRTADGSSGDVPDLTVYRSYGTGFGEMTTPDGDDVHGGRLAVVADSVPDIKIYRRSAALYNYDDDDDNVLHHSSYRVPARSRSAADGVGNGHVFYPSRRRDRDRDRTSANRHHARKSPSSPAPVVNNNRACQSSDFPDTDTVRSRLRQFENCFLAALTRRHAALPTVSARLGIVSFAIHLQSRPRRTVSLLQYLVGGLGSSSPTIPRQLLDPHGDNDGEYIVTVPDGLFHAAMSARDAASVAADNDEPTTTKKKLDRKLVGTAEVDALSDVDGDVIGVWLLLADEMVKCAGREAARELARMFEYQISLLSEDRALRLLAEHAVECAAAYVDHQRGVWERNSLVRGAVFGAVFGHTETVAAPAAAEGPDEAAAERRSSRRVSVIVGHRELKWDIGDVLKRPGLRRDCLLYGVGTPSAPPVAPTFSYHASTTCIDTAPSHVSDSTRRRSSMDVVSSPAVPDSDCPWSFHVSAACDAALYGYRGALLDWDYFASAYAPVADDDGWFNELARPSVDDFHRKYRPYRCLVGTELMQAYCAAASTSSSSSSSPDWQAPTLAEFVRTRLNVEQWARDVVEPVYRPLKALSLGRLRRADFAGTDLTRIGLTGVDLRRTGLRGCVLSHARLTAARLGPAETCERVDVSYASLVDADVDAELLRSPTVTAQFAVVGVRSSTANVPLTPTASELPDDDEVCIDDDAEFGGDNHQLLVTGTDGIVIPVADTHDGMTMEGGSCVAVPAESSTWTVLRSETERTVADCPCNWND